MKTLMRSMMIGLLAVVAVSGADLDLTWWTIDGGGWMWSTGGDYSLGGTIGQADAGVMSGGEYVLTGGFWSFRVCGTADFDCDGDADMVDFLHFQACFNGPNRPPAQAACEDADMDSDKDVDMADFLVFQACFNGPNRPPRCD